MKVKTLDTIPFDTLLDCFLEAFENYFVKMPTDKSYYVQRWKAAKVDYSLSYGMFDEDRLVGFIIHAVDTRSGVKTAFNTGTGVIPEYRGQGLVKAIYDHAIPHLRQNGIPIITLEVITKNTKAVRAYEGVGFEIIKDYMCYAGEIQAVQDAPVELMKTSIKDFDLEQLPRQEYYSWDFQKETIVEGNYTVYQVMDSGKTESFFIINPDNKYVAQLDILGEDQRSWDRLFAGIRQVSPEIKIINVDGRLTDKIDYIQKHGLQNTINQYEMKLKIND